MDSLHDRAKALASSLTDAKAGLQRAKIALKADDKAHAMGELGEVWFAISSALRLVNGDADD